MSKTSLVRNEALQEAAETVCGLCAKGNPVEWYEINKSSGYIHRDPWGWCRADSIHKLKESE